VECEPTGGFGGAPTAVFTFAVIESLKADETFAGRFLNSLPLL
jgi:hypothetical protein